MEEVRLQLDILLILQVSVIQLVEHYQISVEFLDIIKLLMIIEEYFLLLVHRFSVDSYGLPGIGRCSSIIVIMCC